MTIIDLTHRITDKMPTHPYDEKCVLQQIRFLNKDYYNDHRLTCGMHVGTHIDGPAHLLESNAYMSDILVEQFVGAGILIDVRGRDMIDVDALKNYQIPSASIVLFLTEHDAQWGTPEYFAKHPIMTLACAQQLVAARVKMVGFDLSSPDSFPFEVHKYLLSNNVLIIENLTNLLALLTVQKFTVVALPLKVNADSAPARVVALMN